MKRYLVLAVLLTLVACREQDGPDPVSGTHPRPALARDDQVNFKFTQASYAEAIERAGPGVRKPPIARDGNERAERRSGAYS